MRTRKFRFEEKLRSFEMIIFLETLKENWKWNPQTNFNKSQSSVIFKGEYFYSRNGKKYFLIKYYGCIILINLPIQKIKSLKNGNDFKIVVQIYILLNNLTNKSCVILAMCSILPNFVLGIQLKILQIKNS